MKLGKQIIYPVKFNGYEVGELEALVSLEPGETVGDAYRRVMPQLRELRAEMAKDAYEEWEGNFLRACEAVGEER